MNKTTRYISLLASILVCIGSAILLWGFLRHQSISSLLTYTNLSALSMNLYLALVFIISFFAITLNSMMLKTKMNASNEEISSETIDNSLMPPTTTRKHLLMWRLYLVFSILVTLFFPYIFLISSLSPSFHVSTSSLAIVIFSTLILVGSFLVVDARNIWKYWNKKSN